MIVQQALYGHDRGGHALLRSSDPALKAVFDDLSWRTDLPGTAPPGVVWAGYLRGFAYRSYYVVIRTEPDAAAPRSGMVFSHALCLPLDEAVAAADLRYVIPLLRAGDARDRPIEPIRLEVDRGLEPPQPTPASIGIAEALVGGGRPPVVHVGQGGFDEAVASLWVNLPPGIKRRFAFRLSFGPQDVEHDPQTVVCTPASLESRWVDHRMVRAGEAHAPRTRAAALLLGRAEGQRLLGFAGDIGSSADDLRSLVLLDEAFQLSARTNLTVEKLVALARLLARLSPEPAAGVTVKSQVVQDIARAVADMTAAQVRSLRNLDTAAFRDAGLLWAAVGRWATERLAGVGQSARILRETKPGASLPTWSAAILDGFDVAARTPSARLGTALWCWWREAPDLVDDLMPRLALDVRWEAELVATMPDALAVGVADRVVTRAAERPWFRLHGAALAASRDVATAVEDQLAVDRDPGRLAGIEAVLARASGAGKNSGGTPTP